MKRFFLLLLFVILISFPTPARGGQKITNINSIMDQGSTRTCLHGKPTGPLNQPNKGKMITYATLNLDGQCISGSSGCEIWLHNTGNMNIKTNEDMLKYCKNGQKSGHRNYCDDTEKIEDEISYDVDIKPGWTQVTDFTVLSSKPGETKIALGKKMEMF